MATKVTMNLFEAKKKYPELYLIKFEDDNVVIFHLLKWKDFKAYRSILQYRSDLECDAMEEIFQECVLDMAYPFSTTDDDTIIFEEDTMPAGVIDAVSHAIYELSGSNDSGKLFQDLEQSREFVFNDVESRIISTIGTVTKQSFADYNDMYWPDILNQISQNETLMSGDVPSLPFVKGTEEEGHKPIDFAKENEEEGSDLMTVEEGFEARREDTRRRKKELMRK